MWKTYRIWRHLNSRLSPQHHFRYISILKSPSKFARRRRTIIEAFLALSIFVTLVFVATGQSPNILSFTLLFLYLGFGFIVMMILVMIATCGAYLSGKIINRIGFIENWGLYDLISITPDGGEHGVWVMAKIIYQNTRIVIIIDRVLALASLVIIGLFLYSWGLDVLRFSLGYIWFVQGVVLGYLIGLWASYLKTDVTNRAVAGMGLFIGTQLLLALIISTLIVNLLQGFFFQMRWDTTSFLGWTQFIAIILFIEIGVRLILRLIAHQAGIPYSDWRSEVGI